jgi:ATP synthase protein I
MAENTEKENTPRKRPVNDDGVFWSIVGYLISGVLIWGGIGYFADRFFNTTVLLPVGLLIGMTAALYLVWLRFIKE